MKNTNDPLKQFIETRNSLVQEKKELEERLKQIEQALSGSSTVSAPKPGRVAKAEAPVEEAKAPGRKVRGVRGKRAKNKMSLKEAVIMVTKDGPLNKHDILDRVQKDAGYKFSASNPINSLNQILYNKKLFVNEGGKFSPKAGA
jgi:hypothetical protein